MNAQIPGADERRLLSQYNEFFMAAMGQRPFPSASDELREFADACNTAAANLAKDLPEMSADLAKFAKNCREVADRLGGE
jgi:hypothetical protein